MPDRTPAERPPSPDKEALSVIVLACNEAPNVAPVLRELLDWFHDHEPSGEVIFVDDGSTDGTGDIAAGVLEGSRHTLVRHREMRGIGAGIKSGVKAATSPWVTFMPADGQIDPSSLGALRAVASRDGCPLVLSVYDRREDGRFRKVLSWGVRILIRLVHRVDLRCEGPYLFRRELFEAELLAPDSFFLNFEFPIRMVRAGYDVGVAEIRCRPRRGGASKTANLKTIFRVAADLITLRSRL